MLRYFVASYKEHNNVMFSCIPYFRNIHDVETRMLKKTLKKVQKLIAAAIMGQVYRREERFPWNPKDFEEGRLDSSEVSDDSVQ